MKRGRPASCPGVCGARPVLVDLHRPSIPVARSGTGAAVRGRVGTPPPAGPGRNFRLAGSRWDGRAAVPVVNTPRCATSALKSPTNPRPRPTCCRSQHGRGGARVAPLAGRGDTAPACGRARCQMPEGDQRESPQEAEAPEPRRHGDGTGRRVASAAVLPARSRLPPPRAPARPPQCSMIRGSGAGAGWWAMSRAKGAPV